jgi:hypothetical protein
VGLHIEEQDTTIMGDGDLGDSGALFGTVGF